MLDKAVSRRCSGVHDKTPLLLLLLLMLPAAMVWARPVHFDIASAPYQLVSEAEYLQLSEARRFDEIQKLDFMSFGHNEVNQGITADYFWLHFFVDNSSDAAEEWVLRSDTSYLDDLTVYFRTSPDADFQKVELSDREPFPSRTLEYRTLSLLLKTPASGTTEIYLLAHQRDADSISLKFTLHSLENFVELLQREGVLMGIFYGALLLMTVLAVLVGLFIKQPNALRYARFLVSTILMWLMLNGYGFQYVWPEGVYWHNQGFHLSFLFFVYCALGFSKDFLRLDELAPRWYAVFGAVQIIAAIGAALRLVGFYEPVLNIAFFLMSFVSFLIVPASWIAWRRGLDYALWSFIAWIFYSVGLQAALASAYTTKLDWGMDALFLTQAGSLLETLFLMVAMAKWLVAMESDRKQAHALAHEDELTRLGNRRRLQAAFQELAESSALDRETVYLIMIDVDRFKQVNDRYGHDAGDCVLRHLGALLRNSCRQGDLAVRYGGEEFALLIRTAEAESALQIAERIRRQFAENPTAYGDDLIEHSLCCGIAEVASAQTHLNAQQMMQRADAALYQAKEAGRNQSSLYRPGLEGARPAVEPA